MSKENKFLLKNPQNFKPIANVFIQKVALKFGGMQAFKKFKVAIARSTSSLDLAVHSFNKK